MAAARGRLCRLAALMTATGWGIACGRFFQFRAAEWRIPKGRRISPDGSSTRTSMAVISSGPATRSFIDGRALSESLFQDYRKILGSPPGDPMRGQTLDRYGVQTIVANAFEYHSGVLYPLILDLARPDQTEWGLVYEDPTALVFTRNTAAPLEKSRIVDHLESECRLHIEHEPEAPLCARTLGDLFLRSGDKVRARRSLALYLAHPIGDDPEARRVYLQLLQQ